MDVSAAGEVSIGENASNGKYDCAPASVKCFSHVYTLFAFISSLRKNRCICHVSSLPLSYRFSEENPGSVAVLHSVKERLCSKPPLYPRGAVWAPVPQFNVISVVVLTAWLSCWTRALTKKEKPKSLVPLTSFSSEISLRLLLLLGPQTLPLPQDLSVFIAQGRT